MGVACVFSWCLLIRVHHYCRRREVVCNVSFRFSLRRRWGMCVIIIAAFNGLHEHLLYSLRLVRHITIPLYEDTIKARYTIKEGIMIQSIRRHGEEGSQRARAQDTSESSRVTVATASATGVVFCSLIHRSYSFSIPNTSLAPIYKSRIYICTVWMTCVSVCRELLGTYIIGTFYSSRHTYGTS